MEIGFYYGIMYESLEKQANEQGFTLGKDAELLELIRKSINVCMFHVATDSQKKAMTMKLHKKVMKSLSKLD